MSLDAKVQRLLDNWIEECILGDIRQMLRRRRGGNFPVAALLFSVIDLLGGLLRGNVETGHTKNMVAFIDRYLSKIDGRYRSISDLLVDMFRHPLIHTSMSRTYRARSGRYLLSAAIYWEEDTRRRPALIARRKAHLVRKVYKGRDCLIINDHVLHDDLVKAVGLYRNDLRSGRHYRLARRFSRAFDQMTAAVDLAQLKKSPHKQKKELAPKLARQIGQVRRWPVTKAKCFAGE